MAAHRTQRIEKNVKCHFSSHQNTNLQVVHFQNLPLDGSTLHAKSNNYFISEISEFLFNYSKSMIVNQTIF